MQHIKNNKYNILKVIHNFKAQKYQLIECNSKIMSGLINRERRVKIIYKMSYKSYKKLYYKKNKTIANIQNVNVF